MNAIVLNTLNVAVTEYEGFAFQSLTATHAGSAVGLYSLGGELDVAAKIVASIATGKTLLAEGKKAGVEMVFVAMKGSGTSALTVTGEQVSYSYSFPVHPNGVSRCKPGRGFREDYASFGYSNTDGADFSIDQMQVLVALSPNRRTQ